MTGFPCDSVRSLHSVALPAAIHRQLLAAWIFTQAANKFSGGAVNTQRSIPAFIGEYEYKPEWSAPKVTKVNRTNRKLRRIGKLRH